VKLISVILFVLISFSQNPKLNYNNSNDYRAKAISYYKSSNLDSSIFYFKKALEYRKNNPRLIINLAQLFAMNGNSKTSFNYYEKLLELNIYSELPSELKENPRYPEFKKRFEAIFSQKTYSKPFNSIDKGNDIHESVAIDTAYNRLFLSSLLNHSIYVYEAGKKKTFFRTNVPVMSLKISSEFLYASYSYLSELKVDRPKQYGIIKLSLESGQILNDYKYINDQKDHVFGDFILTANQIYISDSRQNTIYELNKETGTYSDLGLSERLVSIQGILKFDSETFVLADYTDGLYFFTQGKNTLKKIQSKINVSLIGIDGIYQYRNYLLIIQNGIQPNRLTALKLENGIIVSSKILAIHKNDINDPTLGHLINDTFYLLANSGWPNLEKDGSIKNKDNEKTHILKIDLSCLD
jgi:tetratricopeptide (TPR) repeat protein